MTEILKEGGYAMKDTGVQRIKKGNVHPTIEHISALTGIPKKELHPLGTTGKTESSGDIDLAVETGRYDPEDIHKRLKGKLGDQNCKYSSGLKIGSYSVPIMRRGKDRKPVPDTGRVQVDLMYVPNMKWAEFSYHSEAPDGKPTTFKGAIRAVLLKAVAASFQEEGVDKFVYEPGGEDLVIRVGRTFDLNKGLRRIFQVRQPRKNPKEGDSPFLKGMKTVKGGEEIQAAFDQLRKSYPEDFDSVTFDVDDREIIIDDPDDFLKVLFPGRPKIRQADVKTAEDIIRLIRTRFEPEQQRRIIAKAKNSSKYLSSKMRVPDWDNILTQSDEDEK